MTNLLDLSTGYPEVTLPSGHVLLEEGAAPGDMYVLVSGQLVIEHDGVAFAQVDSPGAVFGEMSAVLDRPATATVRTVGEVTVRRIHQPVTFLTEQSGAALAVLRTTATRLDGLTQYLVDVKRQFADSDGHLGMVDGILDQLVHHQGTEPRTGSARDPEGDHLH
jgi:CRP/FNR family cyclic AMP-dependent transcriptional regulator